MLLPMYFVIGVWGGPRREYAAIKFFLFTLPGSVFILIALIGFYFRAVRDFDPRAVGSEPKNTFDLVVLQNVGNAASAYLKGDKSAEKILMDYGNQDVKAGGTRLKQAIERLEKPQPFSFFTS